MRNGEIIEFGKIDEVLEKPHHPYTIELLFDYLRYYKNIESFHCPLLEIERLKPAPITYITPTHYIKSWYLDNRAPKINLPQNLDKIKEWIYETIRN